MFDRILSYREMCDAENMQTLQRGMNFRLNPNYTVILMSRRTNAPYRDRILEDGLTIEYEGHDEPKTLLNPDPKSLDQPKTSGSGALTQNGHLIEAVERYRDQRSEPELIKVYEKILPGVWSLKGYFDLIDYSIRNDGTRNVYVFVLKLSVRHRIEEGVAFVAGHTRLIPSEVKKMVWQRDKGKCVICGSDKNLHFDHDLPFSRGGASITAKNIRLLCARCNLAKSDKIE